MIPMRLRQLHYLIEISKAQSISIASENLYISQSALSRSIKSLEEQLGIPLLIRTANGVRLTKFGEELLPQMKKILFETAALTRQAENMKNICSNRSFPSSLTIQTLPTVADSLLPPTLERFSRLYPDIDITIKMIDFSKSLTSFDLCQFDLTIIMNIDNMLDQAIIESNLKVESLFNENLTVVVAHTHPLAKKNSVSLQDALQCKLIVHDNGFWADDFYSRLSGVPQKLNIILKSNNPRAICHLLINQNAVLLTNNLLCQNDYIKNTNLKIIPIKNLKSNYFCLYAPSHPHIRLLEEFISTLKIFRTKL